MDDNNNNTTTNNVGSVGGGNSTTVNPMNVLTSISTPGKSTAGPSSASGKTKDDRYACNKCTKTFARKSHLTRHKMTHEQIKIYCDCGRLFRQNTHFQSHYPACKRKRAAVEAKYLANGGEQGTVTGEGSSTTTVPTTAAETLYTLLTSEGGEGSNGSSNNDDTMNDVTMGEDGVKLEDEEFEAQEINFTEDDDAEVEKVDTKTTTSNVVSPRDGLTTPPGYKNNNSNNNNNNNSNNNNNIDINNNNSLPPSYSSSETSSDLLQQCMALTEKLVGEQKKQADAFRTQTTQQQQQQQSQQSQQQISPTTLHFPTLSSDQLFLVSPEALSSCGSNASSTAPIANNTTTGAGASTSTYLPSANLQQKFAQFAEMDVDGGGVGGPPSSCSKVVGGVPDLNFNIIMKNGNNTNNGVEFPPQDCTLNLAPKEIPPILNEWIKIE